MNKQTNVESHDKHNPFSFLLRMIAQTFENVIIGVWTVLLAAGAAAISPFLLLEDLPALRRYVRMSRM